MMACQLKHDMMMVSHDDNHDDVSDDIHDEVSYDSHGEVQDGHEGLQVQHDKDHDHRLHTQESLYLLLEEVVVVEEEKEVVDSA